MFSCNFGVEGGEGYSGYRMSRWVVRMFVEFVKLDA